MKNLIFICLIPLSQTGLFAQNCPPSTKKGVHIVQKGETLYGLSKMYKTTVGQLRQLNGLHEEDILPLCFALNVGSSGTTPSLIASGGTNVNAVPVGYSYTPPKAKKMPYFKSNARTHVVQKEETLDMIAEYYGYTRARMLYMNNMRDAQDIHIGQTLIVNDCANAEGTSTESIPVSTPQSYSNVAKPHYSSPSYTATSSINNNSSHLDAILGNPNYSWNPAYKKVIHVVSQDQVSQKETPESIGRLHGISAAEVVAMNALNPNIPLAAGQRLVVEERLEHSEASSDGFMASNAMSSASMFSNSTPSYQTPQYTPSLPDVPPPTDMTASLNALSVPTIINNTTMTPEEIQMVNEINLVRSNPAGYIVYIEKYITELKKNQGTETAVVAARELIEQLFKLPILSTLQPMECMYASEKKFAINQRKRGTADHQDIDGSMPWDRVLRECPSLKDSNENLVGGPSDVRDVVILLLVDDGIQSRGHRRTLLQADWKYVACHKMGTIGAMPNYWVQNFGN